LKSGGRVLDVEHRLSILANADPLSGLMTKRRFGEQYQREWERSRRHRLHMSCAMLDIDFFKKVNDTHGHQMGDEAIRTVGRLLTESSRKSDIAGRVGGEEFCVILPETNEKHAMIWAQRVCDSICRTPVVFEGRTVGITISLGIAGLDERVDTPQRFIDLADQSLLAAKQSGRNRVVGASSLRHMAATCDEPSSAPASLSNDTEPDNSGIDHVELADSAINVLIYDVGRAEPTDGAGNESKWGGSAKWATDSSNAIRGFQI
jgi:diguanylate cyclase (GGDEF)-like protein